VLLPVPWELAFATCCLRRIHPLGVMRRLNSQSVLPRGNGLIGQVHQGYLACAIGPGCRQHYRMRLLRLLVPFKVGTFETMTAGLAVAQCISWCRLVEEDVLPG
jgi:hypothetical protein